MTKDVLKQYVGRIKQLIDQSDEFVTNAYDMCNIDFTQSTLYDANARLVDLCITMICDIYTSSKQERELLYESITWFFYEYYYTCKSSGNEMSIQTASMWDKDKNPICYDIDSLCDEIMSYKK